MSNSVKPLPNYMRYRRTKLVFACALCVILGVLGIAWLFWDKIFEYELPSEKLSFSETKPASALVIKDRFGGVLHYVYDDDLYLYRPLSAISNSLVEFVVFLEDAKFYSHNGFDLEQIKNSFEENLERGVVKRGGSTISQQLAKNLFLDKSRSWKRKLFEVPWTIRIEKDFSKKQILELYLNAIEWGPHIHGAEAASRHFFDKSAQEVSLSQAMYLALIIPNPIRFDLFAHPNHLDFLKKKKKWLVARLVDEKKIASNQKETYENLDFELAPLKKESRLFPLSHDADYFGSRDSLKKNGFRKLLEQNLSQFSKKTSKKSEIDTTLERSLLETLEQIQEIPSDIKEKRFFLISEDSFIRAFRQISSGHTLPQDETERLCSSPYQCSEVPNIEWKNLAP